MAKIDLDIPLLSGKFVDLRDLLPGDAYNWDWIRPLDRVNFLAVHHSATSDTQTPEGIANFHISNNGWGGIGYHFLIAKDGTVYYVGDLSTARANVANLNEQVIGICLIGNFIENRVPAVEQLDSAHKLCEFFIKDYQKLSNVNSWDKVRGHKELPNQTTVCPGDNWSSWRIQIVEGVGRVSEGGNGSGNGGIVFNIGPTSLKSQVENLQTSLGLVNRQAIFLQELLQEREQEINGLKQQLTQGFQIASQLPPPHIDNTLTIIETLVKLYETFFPPGKAD